MSYTKYHSSWSLNDFLSGAAFNHIETQWAAITVDADAHNHDSRYYPKASADTTFFSTSFYTGFDADALDGNHFAGLLAAVMPLGAIMVWSGTDGEVPAGWHICDGGTYGGKVSPDLRDRFVIGAGLTYAVDATGGPGSWNGTITPTGTVVIGNHTLSSSEIPSHVHAYSENYENTQNQYYYQFEDNYHDLMTTLTYRSSLVDNQDEGGGSAHGHTGSTATIAGIDPRPLYYALYYIMKYE